MKKIIILLLVLFSLVGCSSSKTYHIGETIEKDDCTITLTKAEFTPAVETTLSDSNFYYPNPNEPKSFKATDGKTYKSTGWADDGKVFLAFEIKFIPNVKKDMSQIFSDIVKLTYDKDYEFKPRNVYYNKGLEWVYMDGTAFNKQTLKLEALNSNPIIIRGTFEVPEEVQNSDKSLEMVVQYFAPKDTIVIR